jgi:hypothetical protein
LTVDPKIQNRIDKIMRVVRLLLWVLLAVIYFFGRLSKVIPVVAILFSLASLVLWVRYPQYFDSEEIPFFQWSTYSAYVGDIILCSVVPPLALGLRALNDFKFPGFRLEILSLLAALLVGALLRFLFRKQNIKVLIAICTFFFLYLSMFGTCAQLNYILDDTSADTQPCRVIDLEERRVRYSSIRRGSHYRTHYYCTVETESGEQTELPISRKQFHTLQRGNWVFCHFGKGALGIKYSYILNASPVPLKKIPVSTP